MFAQSKRTQALAASILILARPGELQDALVALVRSLPTTHNLFQGSSLQGAIGLVAQVQPALVILDGQIADGGIEEIIPGLRSSRPQMRILVLTRSVQGERRARSAGADEVLLEGAPARLLVEAIERLLSRGPELLGPSEAAAF